MDSSFFVEPAYLVPLYFQINNCGPKNENLSDTSPSQGGEGILFGKAPPPAPTFGAAPFTYNYTNPAPAPARRLLDVTVDTECELWPLSEKSQQLFCILYI